VQIEVAADGLDHVRARIVHPDPGEPVLARVRLRERARDVDPAATALALLVEAAVDDPGLDLLRQGADGRRLDGAAALDRCLAARQGEPERVLAAHGRSVDRGAPDREPLKARAA
jgi:hypothetical protein